MAKTSTRSSLIVKRADSSHPDMDAISIGQPEHAVMQRLLRQVVRRHMREPAAGERLAAAFAVLVNAYDVTFARTDTEFTRVDKLQRRRRDLTNDPSSVNIDGRPEALL